MSGGSARDRQTRAFAQAAGGADRGRGMAGAGGGGAVDDLIAEADVAGEHEGGAANPLVIGALRPFQCARDDQELGAVGHLDRIDENLAGLGKGGVNVELGESAPKRDWGKPRAPARRKRLPALSTSSMKKGTPDAPGRCSMVSRLAACS